MSAGRATRRSYEEASNFLVLARNFHVQLGHTAGALPCSSRYQDPQPVTHTVSGRRSRIQSFHSPCARAETSATSAPWRRFVLSMSMK